ncbi:MAG TPA: thioredoxin domain-containing protein [Polyangiaceae bacterium]|nr:thioredoxin domain-containing protein [Polyangiaceae bacterium]
MSLRPPVSEQDHAAGPANAPLTLVEYGDYQCPHCAAADLVVHSVQKAFGARLRFVFRNFPLAEMHPAAEPAAEFAEGSAEQGKFWEAHDAIFAWSRRHGPPSLGPKAFASIAEQLQLDAEQLALDVVEHRYLERIRSDFQSGVRSGVNGTPTFFINGLRLDSPPTVEALTQALEDVLGNDVTATRART